jgi:hypothetical protein
MLARLLRPNLDPQPPHHAQLVVLIIGPMSSDETDKGVCILSFGAYLIFNCERDRRLRTNIISDAGGPGTYSQLLIVKEYMSKLATDLGVEQDSLYPADYFDLMGGVGFGGCIFSSD